MTTTGRDDYSAKIAEALEAAGLAGDNLHDEDDDDDSWRWGYSVPDNDEGEGDKCLRQLRTKLPQEISVGWTGDGNTDASGENTSDLYFKAAIPGEDED